MDPYLEHPALWPDLHASLIVAIRDALCERVGAHYYVAVEQRTYVQQPDELLLVARPDVAVVEAAPGAESGTATLLRPGPAPLIVTLPVPEMVCERSLEVRGVASGRVITVIELLSPANKRRGAGRELYEEKRFRILRSRTHLVELDLLRGGERLAVRPEPGRGDYRLLVARADQRPRAELHLASVRDPLPPLVVPLEPGEEEPALDLKPLLDGIYERARYALRVEYGAPPAPPLEGDDAAWCEALLREAGLRG
jgi:hypothetical protein